MGQGQEYHARKMMTESMAGGKNFFGNQNFCLYIHIFCIQGGWVLLQNVHLSLNFCAEIIDILIETEHVQDSFRLWVTTEVHTEFPIVRNVHNIFEWFIFQSFTVPILLGPSATCNQVYQRATARHQSEYEANISNIYSRLFGLHVGYAVASTALHRRISTHGRAGAKKVRTTRLEHWLRV